MPPVLASPRLTLRPLHPADAGPIGLWCGQYRVASMLARVPHPYPPGAAEAFIDRARSGAGGEQVWALDGTPSGAADFLGVVSLRATGDLAVRTLGYWVGPPAWGLGYATEAVATVLDAAFADPAIAAIETTVYTDNAASARVLEKMGFLVTGNGEKYCPARETVVPEHRLRLDRAAWRGAEVVLAESAPSDGVEAAE
jgi:RimJ/RimL family protein N-acetyltransferase